MIDETNNNVDFNKLTTEDFLLYEYLYKKDLLPKGIKDKYEKYMWMYKRSIIDRASQFVLNVLVLAVLWIVVSTVTASIINPSLTQADLFIRIPHSFILHFY